MSSILQSNQPINHRGVGILVYRIAKPGDLDGDETFTCGKCGRHHERLYRIFRKPAGMCGCWVVFRINGQEMVPDLSVFTRVTKLPRDAKPVDSEYEWHRS